MEKTFLAAWGYGKPMFSLYANKTQLHLKQREPLTRGSVNVYTIQFRFSPDWDGLTRTAVFRAGADGESVSILLDASNECAVPWEVLTQKDVLLFAGVYGANETGETVLPTVWVSLGAVLDGAAPGRDAQPPAPDLWQQALSGKADGLFYDGLNLSLLSGDRTLSTVGIAGGNGEGGGSDHRLLSHRDAPEQHPITAIAGLPKELERIPQPVEPLTNQELEELLK